MLADLSEKVVEALGAKMAEAEAQEEAGGAEGFARRVAQLGGCRISESDFAVKPHAPL